MKESEIITLLKFEADNDRLDEAGANIISAIETIFIKLELFELSSTEKRDLTMARELNDILERTKKLRQRYEANVIDKKQIEIFQKELE